MSHARLALTLVVAMASAAAGVAQQAAVQTPTFSGNYIDLKPEQKLLVDDWCRRFAETMKKTVDPAEAYDNLPLSTRTTFNAVTHALLNTRLTGKSGASLGASALTIVAKIDEVNGMIPGGGSDEQFRIYVQLRPDAMDILEGSQEFGRAGDNTMFHHGYPICFRGRGGTPSIQVSITRDHARADIDVDYRSSSFPVFLFNGHLSASNSDVRAGNNDTRHNKNWSGLNNWWRNLLGLFSVDDQEPDAAGADSSRIPRAPQIAKNAAPEAAIHAFLSTWLVEQRPEEVVPYFDDETAACVQLQSSKPIDHGMVRFAILSALQKRNAQLGRISSLTEAVHGVEMPGVRVKLRPQPHQDEFVLYDIREDLVEQLRCGTRLDPAQVSTKALKSTSFDKYVAAIFRMKIGSTSGDTLATIWAKEDGYWRLITYINEPQVEVTRVLKLPVTPVSTAPMPTVDADSALIRAAADFHTQWFVHGDLTKTMAYLTPSCLPCVNAFLDEGAPPLKTASEQRDRILQGMTRLMNAALASRLADAIKAPNVTHPDLKLVRQSNAAAYAFASLPDSMFAQMDCARMGLDGAQASQPPAGGLVYGTYYATGFRLVKAVGDPAILMLVWAKVDGVWKIVAFSVLVA